MRVGGLILEGVWLERVQDACGVSESGDGDVVCGEALEDVVYSQIGSTAN